MILHDKRVCVLSANAAFRQVLRERLASLGVADANISDAASPAEALTILRQQPADSVLLTSYQSQGTGVSRASTPDLLFEVKHEWPKLPCIVLAGPSRRIAEGYKRTVGEAALVVPMPGIAGVGDYRWDEFATDVAAMAV